MEKPYRTQHDAKQIQSDGEKNKEPSMTKDGEAISIKRVLEKHKMGVPIQQDQTGIYLDSQIEEIDAMHRQSLDLTDIQRHQESLLDRYEQLEKERERILDEKEKAKAEAKAKKEEPETPPKDEEG